MPVHDWTRVSAGVFHDFHGSWITHLKESLNGGLLPKGFYALAEQHAGLGIADILALQLTAGTEAHASGPSATVVAPPRVSRKLVASPMGVYRRARRTIAIRHVSGHRIVALLEVVSPANKDRPNSVRDFVDKAHGALGHGRHLLLIDLFPPGPSDPEGLHALIWDDVNPDEPPFPADKPLLVAAYVAEPAPEAYAEPLAVGDNLPDGPLFLEPGWHINVPLEATYHQAYRGVPEYWRGVLEVPQASQQA
jgi:hypothetical protein